MRGQVSSRMSGDAQARSGRSISLGIVWAVLISIILRGAMLGLGTGQFDDPDNYLPLARSVAEGRGLALDGRLTAYRPPLYPIILAPLLLLGGRALIRRRGLAAPGPRRGDSRLDRGGSQPLWLQSPACDGRGLDRRPRPGPGLAMPVHHDRDAHGVLDRRGSLCLDTSTMARGACWGVSFSGWRASRGRAFFQGAFLVILAPLLVRPEPLRQRAQHAILTALAVLLVLTPWAARNALVFGEPVWTTTHGGYTLALANNEVYYRDVLNGPAGRVWTGADQWLWWDSVNRAAAGMPEPQADRFLRNQALELAVREPVDFTRATLQRLARFWSIAPAMAVYKPFVRYATAAWTLPLWIALGLGLCRRSSWQWPQITAPLMLVGLNLVHALYWTDLRMRAPDCSGHCTPGRFGHTALPDACIDGT